MVSKVNHKSSTKHILLKNYILRRRRNFPKMQILILCNLLLQKPIMNEPKKISNLPSGVFQFLPLNILFFSIKKFAIFYLFYIFTDLLIFKLFYFFRLKNFFGILKALNLCSGFFAIWLKVIVPIIINPIILYKTYCELKAILGRSAKEQSPESTSVLFTKTSPQLMRFSPLSAEQIPS